MTPPRLPPSRFMIDLQAALAGAGWAAYILGSRSAGRHFDQLDGLAVALVVAAAMTLVAAAAGRSSPATRPTNTGHTSFSTMPDASVAR